VKKLLLLVVMVVLVTGVVVVWRAWRQKTVTFVYKTATIDRGDIANYVSATGTVNPVTMVEVGSQVAGVIKQIHVDYNAKVTKGQPLAEIDPTSFQAQVRHAQASVRKATEDVRRAKTLMEENKSLYDKALIAREVYTNSVSHYTSMRALLEQMEAELAIARVNLQHTTIRAPLAGLVVAKQINVGQTVAANAQAPALFLIAEDLAQMKLDTNISEADIGKMQPNQKASFTVDAYPGQTFHGTVWQIRHVPAVVQNVVTYNVVLLIENPDLQLKPGMTAEVNILVDARHNSLRVPRAALRFIPPPKAPIEPASHQVTDASVVWTVGASGDLRAVPIQLGINDEEFAELLDGTLREGDAVVVEATAEEKSGIQSLGSVLPQPKRF
jgi:HlyD family secretion protein